MSTCVVKLNTLEKVKKFVEKMSKESMQYDLTCGNYTVNATSVLGILSLDLNQPLVLRSKDKMAMIPEFVVSEFPV